MNKKTLHSIVGRTNVQTNPIGGVNLKPQRQDLL